MGGIANGCTEAGCALIGGETAEMPDMYAPGEYDLAGFTVAAVEKSELKDGASVAAGDVLIGIASSGPHSNGYSLVRRIYDRAGRPAELELEGGVKLVDALMAPTRLYVKPIPALLKSHGEAIHGMAHITGGGLTENIIRVVPDGLGGHPGLVPTLPPVFQWLQKEGAVADSEMWRTFNCGIGFVLIVAPDQEAAVSEAVRAQGRSTGPSARWSPPKAPSASTSAEPGNRSPHGRNAPWHPPRYHRRWRRCRSSAGRTLTTCARCPSPTMCSVA